MFSASPFVLARDATRYVSEHASPGPDTNGPAWSQIEVGSSHFHPKQLESELSTFSPNLVLFQAVQG